MNNKKLSVSVIGLGHVGLPTAVLLANAGMNVYGMDKNKQYIDLLKSQKTLITEEDFLKMFKKVIKSKKLQFDHKIRSADSYIIAVPTPIYKISKKSNLSMVEDAILNVASLLKPKDLIIIESTSPIGITKNAVKIIKKLRSDLFVSNKPLFSIAYCPERVLPGNLIHELKNNDRVIGGYDKTSSEKAKKLYKNFCVGALKITESKVAEAVKLIENSYRDVNLAYANEMNFLLSDHEIDSKKVFQLANNHPRVNVLNSGVGVGGHCIPIDPYFLIESSSKNSSILLLARSINDATPKRVSKEIRQELKFHSFKKICFIGLTYKPNINDFRESPSIEFLKHFKTESFQKLSVYDPFFQRKQKLLIPKKFQILQKPPQPSQFDCLVVLVNHNSFKEIIISFEEKKRNIINLT